MMNVNLSLAVATLLVILLASIPYSNADCCGTPYSYSLHLISVDRCADCTIPKGTYCGLGDGGCNIFGCNCDGGCRQPVPGRKCSLHCCDKRSDRKAREVDTFEPMPIKGNFTGYDVINYVDENKDGRLDELEVQIFVTRHGLPADAWRHLDVDGDNRLTAHEIDTDLVSKATVMA